MRRLAARTTAPRLPLFPRAVVVVLGLVGLGWWAGGAKAPSASPPVWATCDPDRSFVALRAADASLPAVAAALERATGCAIQIPESRAASRLTLDLTARPLERLLLILARRAECRVSVFYRLDPATADRSPSPGSPVLATTLVTAATPRPLALAEALRLLGIRGELAEGVDGAVTFSARRVPLCQVLDRIASQVGARWQAVVRFEPHGSSGDFEASREQDRRFYEGLVVLTSFERREELAAELARLGRLPPDRVPNAARRLAERIRGMDLLVREAPGEHREGVLAHVQEIQGDLWAVLATAAPGQRHQIEPLLLALRDLQRRLSEIE